MPPQLHNWQEQRGAGGLTSWVCRAENRPVGVSMVRVTHHPSVPGFTVAVEGNLTACVHGDSSTAGSLSAGELPHGVEKLLLRSAAWAKLGEVPPEDWRVTRLDPSQTYRCADGVSAGQVVAAYADVFADHAGGRVVASMHQSSGATAVLRQSVGRSLTVYDKGAEAARKGQAVPAGGLVRVEGRLRPQKVKSGRWKAVEATLALGGDVMDAVRGENEDSLSLVRQVMATGISVAADKAMAAGLTPGSAYRLAAVHELVAAYGWAHFVGRVPPKTVERWRAELRHLHLEDAVVESLGWNAGEWSAEEAAALNAEDGA